MQRSATEILNDLSNLGDEKRIKYNKKIGVTGDQYGVTLGRIRALARKIKTNHSLAIELWKSKNYDAMILASMIFDPYILVEKDIDKLIKNAYIHTLVDEICFHTIAKTNIALEIMKKWIDNEDETYGRGGWALACSLVMQDKLDKSEIEVLLIKIENEMKNSRPLKKEVMNRCLCEIGIKYEEYTERCIEIGQKLEIYKDQKVSKGCTSAYAPEWIKAGIIKKRK